MPTTAGQSNGITNTGGLAGSTAVDCKPTIDTKLPGVQGTLLALLVHYCKTVIDLGPSTHPIRRITSSPFSGEVRASNLFTNLYDCVLQYNFGALSPWN